jgi:hypothetical protein
MKKSILLKIPVSVLWEFREFNRDEVPAPRSSFIRNYSVDSITEYINIQGKVEPLELSVIGNKALLTDGNHRIVAAKRLGYKVVPVNVVVFFGEGSQTFYNHTLDRFKPFSRHLELWLRKFSLKELSPDKLHQCF